MTQAYGSSLPLSVHCFALLHCSANQISSKCHRTRRLFNVSWAVCVSSSPSHRLVINHALLGTLSDILHKLTKATALWHADQCISGMLHCRHHSNQCNRFLNHPFPKPFCLTEGSNHRPVGIKRRRPEAGPAPSPPRPADLASNLKSTVSRVLSAHFRYAPFLCATNLASGSSRFTVTHTKTKASAPWLAGQG